MASRIADVVPLPRGSRHSRKELLLPLYLRLLGHIGIGADAARNVESDTAESQVPHPQLRQMLQRDPAMAALLPGSPCRFALGNDTQAPFVVEHGLILLPPALLDDASALAAAARWGLEAAVGSVPLDAVVRHGAVLIADLHEGARALFLALLPPLFAQPLARVAAGAPADAALLAWLGSRIVDDRQIHRSVEGPSRCELELPVESILVAGGDSRLAIDPGTRRNRYGVPPRPRPEAIHFSSSTASAVSDHGFLYCDLMRRDLLRAHVLGTQPLVLLRRRAAHAIGRKILRLLGLNDHEADVGIAASGTDTELMAVLVAQAGSAGRPLVNLLMAPEESGRGVRLAGSGSYFDDFASTGAPVTKGMAVWHDQPIPLHEIEIRDPRGAPRAAADIDDDFLARGRAALAQGQHVLAHVMLASKTGLNAPSLASVDALVAMAPDQVDVVVDACQMRTPFPDLAGHLRGGWMLQVSGSKFLTGPPFSGALVVPRKMQARAEAVGAFLVAAPGVGHAYDWTEGWSQRMASASGIEPSFGPLFRWLPALLEAELFQALPEDFRRSAFVLFRHALQQRLIRSPFVRPIDVGDGDVAAEPGTADADGGGSLARLSILSFEVLGRRSDGSLAPLGDADCRHLFEQLNCDVTPILPDLDAVSRSIARQQAHIGQPVTLGRQGATVTVLRMVLGARFFNIVGYAGRGAYEAALRSEIADAQRAVDKVELLASRWWRFESTQER